MIFTYKGNNNLLVICIYFEIFSFVELYVYIRYCLMHIELPIFFIFFSTTD